MAKFIYESKLKETKGLPFEPHIAEILLQRGIDTKEKMEAFLSKDVEISFNDLLVDEDKALSLLKNAVLENKEIALYTDYDADGAMAGVIGYLALKNLGVTVHVYTNNKATDGYGLCKTGVDNIIKEYPNCKFILTADNGIAAEDISYAKEKGFTVVVTDHHEPGEKLPPADAIVDAKRKDCTSSYKDMCGAALIFREMEKLYTLLGKDTKPLAPLLEYVAIATIGDVVPLIGLNRALVKAGLKRINSPLCSLPILAIKEAFDIAEVSSYEIGFKIVPLINSVARLTGDITPIIKAFCSAKKSEIESVIAWAKDLNEKRIKLTEEDLSLCKDILRKTYGKTVNYPKALVVSDSAFNEGIVGIVAGRLKSEYNRPSFVFAEKGDNLVGSARSTDFIHVKDLLDSMKDILIAYGGHSKAAGLTISKENLEEFTKRTIAYVEANSKEADFEETVKIDTAVDADEVTVDLVNELSALEPFGEGFKRPVFGLTFDSKALFLMGKDGNHLKAIDKNSELSVICWNGAERKKVKDHFTKAIGYPEKNVYQGKESPQFIVENKFIF